MYLFTVTSFDSAKNKKNLKSDRIVYYIRQLLTTDIKFEELFIFKARLKSLRSVVTYVNLKIQKSTLLQEF